HALATGPAAPALEIAQSAARGNVPVLAPQVLTQPVTDPDGILTSSQVKEIESRLGTLADGTRYELYVVVAQAFDGATGPDWVQQTVERSGFGRTQVVLGIAIGDDPRRYGLGVADGDFPGDAITQIEDDVRDALRNDLDYVAAVDATATTLEAV